MPLYQILTINNLITTSLDVLGRIVPPGTSSYSVTQDEITQAQPTLNALSSAQIITYYLQPGFSELVTELVAGPTGPPGPTGPGGGPQGVTGLQGRQGSPGVTGWTGPLGATGQGIQGSPGVTGPQGAQGAFVTGPAGPIGSPGVTGWTGPASNPTAIAKGTVGITFGVTAGPTGATGIMQRWARFPDGSGGFFLVPSWQ